MCYNFSVEICLCQIKNKTKSDIQLHVWMNLRVLSRFPKLRHFCICWSTRRWIFLRNFMMLSIRFLLMTRFLIWQWFARKTEARFNDDLALLFRQFSDGLISVETFGKWNGIQEIDRPVFVSYGKSVVISFKNWSWKCLGRNNWLNISRMTSFLL